MKCFPIENWSACMQVQLDHSYLWLLFTFYAYILTDPEMVKPVLTMLPSEGPKLYCYVQLKPVSEKKILVSVVSKHMP